MIATFLNFFNMGGHGPYVFASYGAVCAFLIWQWFLPWQQYQKHKKSFRQRGYTACQQQDQPSSHHHE